MKNIEGWKILELSDLTKEEYQFFCTYIYNGVGSRSFFMNPKDFIFKPAARKHDWYYFSVGRKELRPKIDKWFYEDCILLASNKPWHQKILYTIIARIYYVFLKMLGKYAWEEYPEPAKTFQEVLNRVNTYYDRNPKIKGRPPKFPLYK